MEVTVEAKVEAEVLQVKIGVEATVEVRVEDLRVQMGAEEEDRR
jgi:hypothetical protein